MAAHPDAATETRDAPRDPAPPQDAAAAPAEGDGARAGKGSRSPRGAMRRAWRDASFRSALFAFALTRALVFALFLLTAQVDRVTEGSRATTRDLTLSLGELPVSRLLRETIMEADVNWYLTITEKGYEQAPFEATRQHNWAFFPLHPLLWRAASWLTGEYPLTGMLLANLFLFCGLLVLHKFVLVSGWDEGTADRAVFYLAAFPVSYFLSLPLTESLFLFLAAAAFYAGARGRWWLAALAGALASVTRVIGVLLLPALLLLHWRQHRRLWPPAPAQLLLAAVVPSGLVAFMCYLYAITGNALAFKDVLVAWDRQPTFFLATLARYLKDPLLIFSPWDFRLLNFAASVTLLVCGLVLLKWRRWALACYTLSCIYLSLSSGLLQSQARYATVVFPAFIVLAVAGQRPRVDRAIRTASLILLCLLTVLFTLHYTPVMS